MTIKQTGRKGPLLQHDTRRAWFAGLGAAAALAMATAAAAQPPHSASPTASGLAGSAPISRVDISAPSLADQPNMHGLGVTRGPDGHPHIFCTEPSDPLQLDRLRLDLQRGDNSVRYQ